MEKVDAKKSLPWARAYMESRYKVLSTWKSAGVGTIHEELTHSRRTIRITGSFNIGSW